MVLNKIDWKRSALPALFGALAFFLILWRLDFPKPMVDDLFYNGAALHMADGGDFSNPFLIRQGFPNHFFYVHSPILFRFLFDSVLAEKIQCVSSRESHDRPLRIHARRGA